jgi:sulfur-oxidizing protein SoxA
MPCRRALAALLCVLGATSAGATPDSVKAEVAQRVQSQWPQVPLAELARGAAAFDAELRAELEAHVAEGSAPLAASKARWDRRFKDGRSLANCFPNGGRRVAGSYPLFDPKLKRVITFEMAINQCLKSHGEAVLEPQELAMAELTAYARSLSNGQKVAVRVPAGAADRFEQGRRLYFTRMGQRNFACASCHVASAGKHYGNETLSSAIGQAAHWPIVRNGVPVTLQVRIRECLELMGAAPFPAGSDELNHLEYFLAYLSNGLPLQANAWRPSPPSRPTAATP